MRKATWFAAVSMLLLGFVVLGCGKLSKEEFNQTFNAYKAENTEKFNQVDSQLKDLGTKLDQEVGALKESTAKDIETTRDSVLEQSEQGDAETLEAAKQEDKKTLEAAKEYADKKDAELRKAAMKAAEKAEKNAKAEAQAAAQKASEADAKASRAIKLANAAQETADKALKSKPVKIAVVYFATAKATLTDEAKATLDGAIDQIPAGAVVRVYGHADGRPVIGGKYRSNWDLSEARANAVKEYLASKGVSNEIQVEARAHTEPAAAPYTKEGRQKNRRAEVWVYPVM